METKGLLSLSPSAAERWSHCPGSEYIIRRLPRLPSTQAADEGTLAHAFAAWSVASMLKDVTGVEPANGMPEEPQRALATEEMLNAAQIYADSIFSKLCSISQNFAGDGFEYGVEAECFVHTEHVWVCGRIDFYAITGDRLVIADFKYGSYMVPAAGNPQMLTYAACVCSIENREFDVSLGIAQPRSEVSDFSEFGAVWKDYSHAEFKEAFKPLAEAARAAGRADEKTPRVSGDWCRFCPARSVCRAAIGEKLLLACIAAGESQMKTDATNEQIGLWLDALKEVENARDDLTRIAKMRIQNGEGIPGWRIQNRKGLRWAGVVASAEGVEAQAAVIQELTGLNASLFIRLQLRTVSDMKKTIPSDELKNAVEESVTQALIKVKP